jgi:hypothetical protein
MTRHWRGHLPENIELSLDVRRHLVGHFRCTLLNDTGADEHPENQKYGSARGER